MARSQNPNSASSQFFICYNDKNIKALDGKYAAFGKVIEGMETVDAFLEIPTDSNDKPTKPIEIESMKIITK